MTKDSWDIIFGFVQGVGALATAGSLIYIVRQVKLQKKEIGINLDYQKREKALEMCQYYENLLDDIFEIQRLFKEYWKNLNIQPVFRMEKFTKDEILEKHSESEVEKMQEVSIEVVLKQYFEKNLTKENIKMYNIFDNRGYKEFSEKDFKKMSKDVAVKMRELNTEFILLQMSIGNKTYQKFNSVLNKLEYFSMSFISGIADEEVVYQSLHQSFFTIVSFFYPSICLFNSKGGKDKYYTNLIELYNIWKKREKKQEKTEKQYKQKMSDETVVSSKSKII